MSHCSLVGGIPRFSDLLFLIYDQNSFGFFVRLLAITSLRQWSLISFETRLCRCLNAVQCWLFLELLVIPFYADDLSCSILFRGWYQSKLTWISIEMTYGMKWHIPAIRDVSNMFQFSSTDLSSGFDAKNADHESDINFRRPSKLALL